MAIKPEYCILTSIIIFIAIILVFTNYGPADDVEHDVVVNVLYTGPVNVVNTTVSVDGEVVLSYVGEDVETYPPFVGDTTVVLEEGKHNITVTDANFGHTRTVKFDVYQKLFIDVIIGEDGIDIDVNKEQTEYE